MNVGQLAVGAGIGLVGGGAAYAMLRPAATDNPIAGIPSLLGGAGAITWGLFMPSGPVKLAMIGVGAGAVIGGGLGLRDGIQGAIDEHMSQLPPELQG
jgi:hypothetical protein